MTVWTVEFSATNVPNGIWRRHFATKRAAYRWLRWLTRVERPEWSRIYADRREADSY